MKILVKSLFKTNRLTKVTNGNNIFISMQSALRKTPDQTEFILDMNGVASVSPIVFMQVRVKMQSTFKGNYTLRLENSLPMINKAFQLIFGG